MMCKFREWCVIKWPETGTDDSATGGDNTGTATAEPWCECAFGTVM